MIKLFSRIYNSFVQVLNDGMGDNPIHATIEQRDCTKAYMKKRKYCLACGEILENKKRVKIVNSQSEEAKNYNFHYVDGYYYGNVRFIILYFACPKCGKEYEVRDYVKFEKRIRRYW